MKHENINYLMVGLLVIVSFVLLFAVLIQVSGKIVATETYYVVYGDISGVKEGTAVTFGGYSIGQVTNIAPVRNGKTKFKLTLEIDEQWQLPKDSVARIASPGLLSDKVVDIVEGDSKQTLAAGSTIRGQESASLFAAVDEVAFEIKDLSENSIRPMLKKFSNSVDSISERIDNIGGELDQGIPSIIDNADRFMVELNHNVDRLSKILNGENEAHIANTMTNLDEVSQNLVDLTGRMDTTLSEFDSLVKTSNNVVVSNDEDIRRSMADLRKTLDTIAQNIDSIVYNLDTTTRNFNEFSRQIRMNPGVLLGGNPPRDAGEAAK